MGIAGRPFLQGLLTGSALSLSTCAMLLYSIKTGKLHVGTTMEFFNPSHLNAEYRPALQESSLQHSMEDVIKLEKSRGILKYGAPDRGPLLRYYNGHVLAYDQARKIPIWVAEHIDKNSIKGSANRKNCKFKPDPDVPAIFNAAVGDYRGSGWSRGHMTPAGDYKNDQNAMNESFYLSNVVPQDLSNNAGFWNRFEIYCRNLTQRFDSIHIITGPLFLPNLNESNKTFVKHEVVGKGMVFVPTHLYKVIVAEKDNVVKKSVGAFIVPNEPIGYNQKLTDYQVHLDDIQQKAGISFLPRLNRNLMSDLCVDDSCKLMERNEFELYFLCRRLKGATTIERLEKVWGEIEKKNLTPDDYVINVYRNKTFELGGRDMKSVELRQ